jgi:hypothetical protein
LTAGKHMIEFDFKYDGLGDAAVITEHHRCSAP